MACLIFAVGDTVNVVCEVSGMLCQDTWKRGTGSCNLLGNPAAGRGVKEGAQERPSSLPTNLGLEQWHKQKEKHLPCFASLGRTVV